MPAEITAPRISSNMALSQPVAGVEVQTARGEEADADGDKRKVQHIALLNFALFSIAVEAESN